MSGREAQMVEAYPGAWCDPEVATIVRALNAGGVATVASCSGHGHRPGNIALADGRELFIAAGYAEARQVDAAFPVDINGERRAGRPCRVIIVCAGCGRWWRDDGGCACTCAVGDPGYESWTATIEFDGGHQ